MRCHWQRGDPHGRVTCVMCHRVSRVGEGPPHLCGLHSRLRALDDDDGVEHKVKGGVEEEEEILGEGHGGEDSDQAPQGVRDEHDDRELPRAPLAEVQPYLRDPAPKSQGQRARGLEIGEEVGGDGGAEEE